MAKHKSDNQKAKQPRREPTLGPWPFSYWLRLTLSVLLVWHLFVVFIAPLSLLPKPSELAGNTAQSTAVRWYSEPLYLNGGYSFFSPDPPRGGRLIRFKVFGDSGESIVEGEFPNRNNLNFATQWPRLWYHRHMMLVDQSPEVRVYRPAPGDFSPESAMRAERLNQELALKAFARHLLRKHGGRRIVLELIAHDSLTPEQSRGEDPNDPKAPLKPVSPTDPILYRTEMTVQASASELEQPLLPQSPGMPEAELLPMGAAG